MQHALLVIEISLV